MRAVFAGLALVLLAGAPKPANQSMQVTTWFSLDEPGHGHSLIVSPVHNDSEDIIVFASRRAKLEAEWRADIEAGQPVYEPSQSQAAQRLYAPSPIWASPEQQRLTSTAKDYLGVCGVPLIECPNLH